MNSIVVKKRKLPVRIASKVEEPYRVNEKITGDRVRLVCDGIESRECSLKEALQVASDMNLDLVEISRNSNPPVCKILNYSKFKYQQKKKQKEVKLNASKNLVKEIKLGPNMGEHDFEFKLRHAIEFLNSKCVVKMYIHFVGRTMCFKDNGEILLRRFIEALKDYGKVEKEPQMEGKRMFMVISPKSKL